MNAGWITAILNLLGMGAGSGAGQPVAPAWLALSGPRQWTAQSGPRGWLAGAKMAAVLTSGNAQKAAGDTVRMPMDFGDVPEIQAGATITGTPTVTVTAVTTGSVPTVSGIKLDYPYQVSFLLTGGTGGGLVYNVAVTISLNNADATVISRTGQLTVL